MGFGRKSRAADPFWRVRIQKYFCPFKLVYQELDKRAGEVRELYNQLNAKDGHKKWGAGEYMEGFVGDVGDLAKLVMAKNGFRGGENVDEKLGHELADCLWSILVLSRELNIDLEKEFEHSMNDLESKIKEKLH
jgi:NTP pyrophosphatase (non-canonical NTP hydrolase)